MYPDNSSILGKGEWGNAGLGLVITRVRFWGRKKKNVGKDERSCS